MSKSTVVESLKEAKKDLRSELTGKLEDLGFGIMEGCVLYNGATLDYYTGTGMSPLTVDHLEKVYVSIKNKKVAK